MGKLLIWIIKKNRVIFIRSSWWRQYILYTNNNWIYRALRIDFIDRGKMDIGINIILGFYRGNMKFDMKTILKKIF